MGQWGPVQIKGLDQDSYMTKKMTPNILVQIKGIKGDFFLSSVTIRGV